RRTDRRPTRRPEGAPGRARLPGVEARAARPDRAELAPPRRLAALAAPARRGLAERSLVRAEPLANDVSPWRQRLSEQLRSAVTRGVLWTTGGYGVGQALRLATNLVVTRLLNPEAFGLMAIVNSLLIGAEMVSDTGIVQTLVQRSAPPDRELLDTAWAVHALRGLALFAVLALLSGPIASWYGEPSLVGLLSVSAFALVLDGLCSTGKFVAVREMALRRLVLVDLTVQISGIAVMLAIAWHHRSVWALALSGLVSSGVGLVLSHV